MKPVKGSTVYKLIHSQQMVRYMWRYSPHKQSTQIPCALVLDEKLDFNVLARSANAEIKRNDCLRLRIFRDGFDIKQFFLNDYSLEKVQVKEFSSKKQQEEFFDMQSSKRLNVFAGETFRIIFFRTFDEKSGIYLLASHMIMDAAATYVFFRDLLDVYDSIKNNLPMPRELSKFEDVIKNELCNTELENHIKEEKEVLKQYVKMDGPPLYCGINGPVALEKERRLRLNKNLRSPSVYFPLTDKSHYTKLAVSVEDSRLISRYTEQNNLSPEWVIQVGLRIYLSKLNYHENDTLLWVLNSRRKTVKEKRCGGTMASPLPWREQIPGNKTFLEAVKQLAQTQSFLFRHTDVPFTEVRKIEQELFHYSVLASANSMMFSYLPLKKDTFGGRTYEYTGYSMGHYVMPLYTIAMKDELSGRYKLSYIHRTSVYSDNDVLAFHNGAIKLILSAIANPEKTIEELWNF